MTQNDFNEAYSEGYRDALEDAIKALSVRRWGWPNETMTPAQVVQHLLEARASADASLAVIKALGEGK
jgi:hypothetical protein